MWPKRIIFQNITINNNKITFDLPIGLIFGTALKQTKPKKHQE